MNILATRLNNLKVKAQYVLDNTEEVRKHIKITSGTLMLINLAKRDGLKCDCCGDDSLYFMVHPENGLVLVSSHKHKKRQKSMTMDHDILKSLDGTNQIDNQHLLCERCNIARGNAFAEYSEFKQWFKEQVSLGRNPYNYASSLVQNFCYIDFQKNLGSMKDIEHLAKGSVFPPFLRNHLIEMYMKNGKFVRSVNSPNNSYNFTNDVLLTRYNNYAWDELINALVVMIIEREHKYRIQNPNIDFSVYKMYNRRKMTADDFLNIVHQKIQTSVYNLGQTAITERRAAIRKQNLASIAKQSDEMQQKVQQKVQEQHIVIVPEELTWWQKIVQAFKALIA
jgi:hypothetical protein